MFGAKTMRVRQMVPILANQRSQVHPTHTHTQTNACPQIQQIKIVTVLGWVVAACGPFPASRYVLELA